MPNFCGVTSSLRWNCRIMPQDGPIIQLRLEITTFVVYEHCLSAGISLRPGKPPCYSQKLTSLFLSLSLLLHLSLAPTRCGP